MPTTPWGQPIGQPVPGWTPARVPTRVVLAGRDVRLVDLDPDHDQDLYAATCASGDEARWTYLQAGPFESVGELTAYLDSIRGTATSHPLAILQAGTGRVLGTAAYLNIVPGNGSIEVGSITYGPELAGTRGATEAMALMMGHAFDTLGYRRYEWKCDSRNTPSRRAAERLGFTFEGTFRQHVIYKGRNRDTAWFSITDAEWPRVSAALSAWLAPGNFDAAGRQRHRLEDLRAGG